MSDETVSRLLHECRRFDDEQVADIILRLTDGIVARHLQECGDRSSNVQVFVGNARTAEGERDPINRHRRHVSLTIVRRDKDGARRRTEVQKP